MPNEPYFDGRAFVVTPLVFSLRERLVVRIATQVMPLLTRVVLSNRINTWLWQILGCRVGPRSVIRTGTAINAPFRVSIGSDCLVHGHLKSRGGIKIGNGVELVDDVLITTQSHNMDSAYFESVYRDVNVCDYAWLGPRSIILPGVVIGEGSAVAAGAVVTRTTEAWSVNAGVPARRIKRRVPLGAVAKP